VDAERSVFEALVGPLIVPGYELAFTMLRDRGEAEDVVQEASLKAWRGFGQLRGGTRAVRPWFLAIVANNCRSVRRGRWWSLIRLPDLPGLIELPEDRLAAASDLRRAIRQLSDRQRVALFLFFYLDLPVDEVATVIGINAVAAKSLLARAIRKLRAVMIPEESV
jgi:RNA polymerase sigma-70 factor (ECF subfamily)